MTIVHLNCGTIGPLSERVFSGEGAWTGHARIVTHCLLVETASGLVLVDTGIGLQDVAAPARRLGWAFARLARPVLDPDETAARQVERLGARRSDVRHVVLTHLDLDHAGGLADFPDATVHVLRQEHSAATRPREVSDRLRYRRCQWAHGPKWHLHDPGRERLEGFDGATMVLEPDVMLVPLPGHSAGHAGVAVRDGDRWLLHCGDAYFDCREVSPPSPWRPAGLGVLQRLIASDNRLRLAQQAQLREAYLHAEGLTMFCSHDLEEFEALSRDAVAQA